MFKITEQELSMSRTTGWPDLGPINAMLNSLYFPQFFSCYETFSCSAFITRMLIYLLSTGKMNLWKTLWTSGVAIEHFLKSEGLSSLFPFLLL